MNAVVTVFHYQTSDRRIPFREWLDAVTDPVAFAAVQLRVDRLERGLFGDCEPVGGGDKRTQKADIKRAKEYWKDHEERKRAGGRTR